MPGRIAIAGLLAMLPLLPSSSLAARADDPCRRCRTECREDVQACVDADPRVASCRPKRRAACLRRAARDCKRNRKKCCLRTCRATGEIVCCGSAVSATTLPGATTTTTLDGGGATTTTTTAGGTTTTVPGGCASDLDCPSCGCCDPVHHVCAGATGNSTTVCCNIPPDATEMIPGSCGPQTPAVCPQDAICAPPGQLLGGIKYACQFCADSGRIIEQFFPSGQLPKTFPSNECLRR